MTMTRDEILAMEAGRELDALVAERVMGLDVVMNPESAMCVGCRVSGGGAWVVIEYDYHEWGHKVVRPLPYSTDIAAAWEVVEKLEADGIGRLELVRLGWDWNRVWRATFFSTALTEGVTGKADTAPLAICLAALLAAMEAEDD